jgi:hypothetical protein
MPDAVMRDACHWVCGASVQIINADNPRERAQLKAQLAQDLQQGWQRQVSGGMITWRVDQFRMQFSFVSHGSIAYLGVLPHCSLVTYRLQTGTCHGCITCTPVSFPQIEERTEVGKAVQQAEVQWPFGPTGAPNDKRPFSAISRPPISPRGQRPVSPLPRR